MLEKTVGSYIYTLIFWYCCLVSYHKAILGDFMSKARSILIQKLNIKKSLEFGRANNYYILVF